MELEPHIMALIGAATAAAGVGLVVWSATAAASSDPLDAPRESLLAPTLAVDTLDSDLRVAYMRTLVLDARMQVRHGEQPTELGRELRRGLVALQAIRHAGDAHPTSIPLLELIDLACDAADGDLPSPWDDWLAESKSMRRELARGPG